jgi:hypothetical protein
MGSRATLTVVASAIRRISVGHAEMVEVDAGFDGGEFSGPAHWDAERRETAKALQDAGWTAGEFMAEVEARTTPKWVFFYGGFQMVDQLADEQQQELDYGTRF